MKHRMKGVWVLALLFALGCRELAPVEPNIPSAERLQMDIQAISEYLEENDLVANRMPSGIHYIIEKEGEGENAAFGDIVSMRYKGYLLDGREFDQNLDAPTPLVFNVGGGQLVPGMDIAIRNFNLGSEGKIFLPSGQAYAGSPPGGSGIPQHAVLVFDIRITNIRR